MGITRVTSGLTSLSSCSHLPTIEYSKLVKPVRFPSGRARLVTNPPPTGSLDLDEHDRNGLGGFLHGRGPDHALGEDDVRLQADQLVGVALDQPGIAPAEAELDLDGLPFDP